MKNAFAARRDYFVERVKQIPGVSCLEPEGAFYIFMNIKEQIGRTLYGVKINTSDDFAKVLLEKGLVAVVPGSAFGSGGLSPLVLRDLYGRYQKRAGPPGEVFGGRLRIHEK